MPLPYCYFLAAVVDAFEEDVEVLVGDLARGQVAAGPVPADRHPHRVAQEPVDELDVEVGPQLTGRDPVAQQPGPEVAEAHVALLEVGEALEARQVGRI